MSSPRPAAIAIGVAVAIGTIAIAFVPDSTFYRATVAGLTTGTGSAGAPINLSISKGAEFSGAGTIASPLSFEGALSAFTYGEFGDGSDGACDFTGGAVLGLSPASNVYTLTREIFCDTMSVGATYTVEAPAHIFVLGTLTLDGKISRNGSTPAADATNGAAKAGVTLTGTSGGNGGRSGNIPIDFCDAATVCAGDAAARACAARGEAPGAGLDGLPGANATVPGCGGGGGSQCNSATNVGTNAPVIPTTNIGRGIHYLDLADGWAAPATAVINSAGGGGAGRGGVNVSGAGGGGGWVSVHAAEIVGSGSIEAKGGNGFPALQTTTNCSGAGGGGGGGVVTVVIRTGDFPTVSVAGGIGGTGVTCLSGSCTGLKGGDGGNGASGFSMLFRVGPQ